MGSFDVPEAFNKPPVKEQAPSHPLAAGFLQKLLSKWQEYSRIDDVAFVEQRIKNLSEGNEYQALEFMEEMKTNLPSYTDNVDEWRMALHEISAKLFSHDQPLDKEKLYDFFDEEFQGKDESMRDAIHQNPRDYTRKEQNEWKVKNDRWFNAATYISQGEFRLACDLIEEEIADQLDWRKSRADTIDEYKKHKSLTPKDEELLESYRQEYRTAILRIGELRTVRNSLYQLLFKK